MVKGPLVDLARDTQRLAGTPRHRRMARKLPVRHVEGLFNLTDRLHYVDSRGAFAYREFCLPDGPVQIGGQVDIDCHPVPLTAIRGIAWLDQVSWFQFSPCAVVEPLRTQLVGCTEIAFVHVCILLNLQRTLRLSGCYEQPSWLSQSL